MSRKNTYWEGKMRTNKQRGLDSLIDRLKESQKGLKDKFKRIKETK